MAYNTRNIYLPPYSMKKCPDCGLLMMRIGLGALFIWGGLEKFFEGFLGGVGLQAVANLLGDIGFSFLGESGLYVAAVILAAAELIAGIMILVGAYACAASAAMAVVMIGALVTVHVQSGNWMMIVIHFALVMVLMGMAFTGGGKKAMIVCDCK